MFNFKTNISFNTKTTKMAKHIYAVFSSYHNPNQKSKVIINLDKNKIQISFSSSDPISLRATFNAYLRILSEIYSIEMVDKNVRRKNN